MCFDDALHPYCRDYASLYVSIGSSYISKNCRSKQFVAEKTLGGNVRCGLVSLVSAEPELPLTGRA